VAAFRSWRPHFALGRAAGWQRALGDPEVAVEHDFGDAVPYWLLQLADALTESG